MRARNAETGEITIRGMVLTADDIQVVVEHHGLAEVTVHDVTLDRADIRFILDCQRMGKFIRINPHNGSFATIAQAKEAHQ